MLWILQASCKTENFNRIGLLKVTIKEIVSLIEINSVLIYRLFPDWTRRLRISRESSETR